MPHRINMSCGQTDLYPECLTELGIQLGGPLYYPPYREIEGEARELLKNADSRKSRSAFVWTST